MARKTKTIKVKAAKPYGPANEGDPTPERMKQAGEGMEPRRTETNAIAYRATDCDILNHLASRKVIDGDQLVCGERYFRDWYRAGLAASGVVDPGRVIVDGGNSDQVADAKLDALSAWAKATKAVGPTLAHPLTNMVLLQETATVYAMRYLGKRDPKDMRLAAYIALGLALDALVLHYLGPRRRKPSHGMMSGARPGIVIVDDVA